MFQASVDRLGRAVAGAGPIEVGKHVGGSPLECAAEPADLFQCTLKRRAADVLAYFERPGTSNGPTEAINGRLEHLRGSALGFRNLTNYIARSLLETGGFRPRLHPHSG